MERRSHLDRRPPCVRSFPSPLPSQDDILTCKEGSLIMLKRHSMKTKKSEKKKKKCKKKIQKSFCFDTNDQTSNTQTVIKKYMKSRRIGTDAHRRGPPDSKYSNSPSSDRRSRRPRPPPTCADINGVLLSPEN